ncbi:hypothetical protein [Actinoplanes sp. NPDC051851]|uniref:hypothetical protein n=1 Tax=Actinoplanes sp. NPDC051851 TaxID=3154753 RepID=UPI003421FBEB
MRVELDPLSCNGSDALHPLLMLLGVFTDERHEWAADEPAIAALATYFEGYAPTVAPAVRSLGQKAIVNAAWSAGPGPAPVRVTRADLPNLAHDLSRPAVLIVEDLVNDGAFVRAVAAVFGSRRVLTALANQWLEFRHAGGTGRFPAVVEAELAGFRTLARIALLADSDRWMPGQVTKIHRKAADFRAAGLSVHVLELREAENYLPHRVLAACGSPSTASATLTALKKLSPDQRGHYDMKNGFGRRAEPAKIRPEQQALFDGLDPHIRDALRGGFGDGLLPVFERHCARVKVADIAALGAHVEADLRALLSTIESVI